MTEKLIGVGIALFAAIRIASAGQGPSKARLDAIWDAADDRISRQIDIWFDEGDFPKDIHLLTFQAAYEPHDYEAATNLGWMLENVEDPTAALAEYARYRKDNPQDKDAVLPEGQFYYMTKQYAKIPAILEPALKRHPHPNVYRILAHSYEKLNRLSDADRVWKQYLAWQPNDGPAKVNLARVEKKLNVNKSR